MSVVPVGTPTNVTTASGTSCDVPKPASAAEGDLLYLLLSFGSVQTVTPPDGTWTELFDEEQPSSVGSSNVYIHEVGASDPSTYSFTKSPGDSGSGICGVLRGHKTGDPVNAVAAVQKSTSTSLVCGSLTTTVPNCLILRLGAVDGNRTFTVDGGTTELDQHTQFNGSNCSSVAAYEMQATAGSTGSATHTISASDQWTGYSIAIQPGTNANVAVPAASIVFASPTPTVATGASVDVTALNIAMMAWAPSIPTVSEVPSVAITLQAHVPSIVTGGDVVAIPAAHFTMVPYAPGVSSGAAVAVPAAAFTLAAVAPFIETDSSVYVPPATIVLTPYVPAVFVGDVYVKAYRRLITLVPPLKHQIPSFLANIIDNGQAMYPTIVWEKGPSEKPRYGIDWSFYIAEWDVAVGDSQWVNTTPGGGNVTFSQTAQSVSQTDTILVGGVDGATEYIENRVTFSDGSSRHVTIKVIITDGIPGN